MNKTLIYGHKSFISKNFLNDYSNQLNFYLYKNRYNKKRSNIFEKKILSFLEKNNINYIINFAANNNNSQKILDFEKILESNFHLPLSLIKVCEKLDLTLVLFLSKDMSNSNEIKNFYSLSKEMLKTYIANTKINCKLRVFDIDSVYGPYDFNYRRLIPSICSNLFKANSKKKIKILNIQQKKNFIYVKKLNKLILKSLFDKKKFLIKDIKSTRCSIKKIINIANKVKKHNNLKFIDKNHIDFLKTFMWYKDHYGKK